MRKPKLRELAEAVRALVRGPVTTRFPAVPHEPPDAFRGKPEFHPDDCVGCKACAEVCPARCLEVIDDPTAQPPRRRIVLHYDRCIFCGHCALNCTTQRGIRLSKQYDLACFDRSTCVEQVDNELVICELCGAVVAAKKHLMFVAERLGAQRYANPSLLLLAHGEDGFTPPPGGNGAPRNGPRTREDIMRVTCPNCRRIVVLRELWGE